MKKKLSILTPSIRTENWLSYYQSIEQSTTCDFELILVGPKYSPVLEDKKNVKFIQDYGSPTRCQQIALINSVGEIVAHSADDCTFIPGMIDKVITELNYVHVVITKYTEGSNIIQDDDYYILNKAYPYSPYINDKWWIFNSMFAKRYVLEEVGGYDTQFNVACIAFADLAVRVQRKGYLTKFLRESVCHCGHGQQDHKPIEESQIFHDQPLYSQIHNTEPNKIKIDLNNWMNAPEVWKRYV